MKSSVNRNSSSFSSSFLSGRVVQILLGTFLMFFCSQVSIPLEPVPITLHTVGVLIIGLTYKKQDAVSAVGLFLILGAIGVPVFSGFIGGIDVFFRSNGGYLVGMLLGVYVISSLKEKFGDGGIIKLLTYSTLGLAVTFACGLLWLANFVGVEKAIQFGLLPFILPGIVKCLFTASSIRVLKNISSKAR